MASKLTLDDMRSRTGFTLTGDWQERELHLLDEVVQRFREVARLRSVALPGEH